jgi:hypothetical protein
MSPLVAMPTNPEIDSKRVPAGYFESQLTGFEILIEDCTRNNKGYSINETQG